MRIALGADHAGFDLKESLRGALAGQAHEVFDLGTFDPSQPDDYPDYAVAVGRALQQGQAERGLLLCGSGVGVSVAANKIPGIRAGLCHDTYSAHQGVEHDHMNVLVLGVRVIGPALAEVLVAAFLHASPSHEARHERRLRKIRTLEDDPPRSPGGGNHG
jgi:RpiB/LacA/LacB family sugar-phosphate isomerase